MKDASPRAQHGAHPDLWRGALSYVRHTSICFIFFSLVLVYRHELAGSPESELWLIRAGTLRDLAAELPIGRQSLVGSLAVMPLPSLAALPFLALLSPASTGYAYLYGLALLLACAAQPLRELLNGLTRSRAGAGAPGLLALAAFLLGDTGWSDLPALLAMVVLAVYLEMRKAPEVRALSGVFWALALLTHGLGLVLAGARLAAMVIAGARKRGGIETRAVNWIRGTAILYGLMVYLFLNGMIMGSPFYPFLSAPWWRVAGSGTADSRAQLDQALATRYSDCRPVVSGVWGYVIEPLLEATEGCHLADYHSGKLPPDETGDWVLVAPSGRNPFVRFSDWHPDAATLALPLCEQWSGWIFVRLEARVER